MYFRISTITVVHVLQEKNILCHGTTTTCGDTMDSYRASNTEPTAGRSLTILHRKPGKDYSRLMIGVRDHEGNTILFSQIPTSYTPALHLSKGANHAGQNHKHSQQVSNRGICTQWAGLPFNGISSIEKRWWP